MAGLCSTGNGGGKVKCCEIARDRRCLCRELFSGSEGVEVYESGEAGGEVGNGSSVGDIEEIWRDGIDSK